MRSSRRLVLAFLCLALVTNGTVARARATVHARQALAPVVLRPKWHLLASRGVAVVAASGRYTYVGRWSGSATVIDEQTKRTIRLAPPAGCFFETELPPIGGSWVVASCHSPSGELMLYSMRHANWTRVIPDTARMCALNPDCGTSYPRSMCSAQYAAIGNRWIEFSFGCGYHSGTVTQPLQHIRGGQVIDAPGTAIPGLPGGGTDILDLNSSTGTRPLCSPLRVATHGNFVTDGRFAVAENNLNENVSLEHCGSRSPTKIGRGIFSANARAVLMSVGSNRSELGGVFLPSRRRFNLRLPRQVASLCARELPFVCIQGLELTRRAVYVLTDRAQLWSAGSPMLPTTGQQHPSDPGR